MSKQEPAKSPHQGNAEANKLREGHYYVQTLTEQIFLVRQCLSAEGKPGADDQIVRSFDVRHDAYTYANSMNEEQNAG